MILSARGQRVAAMPPCRSSRSTADADDLLVLDLDEMDVLLCLTLRVEGDVVEQGRPFMALERRRDLVIGARVARLVDRAGEHLDGLGAERADEGGLVLEHLAVLRDPFLQHRILAVGGEERDAIDALERWA